MSTMPNQHRRKWRDEDVDEVLDRICERIEIATGLLEGINGPHDLSAVGDCFDVLVALCDDLKRTPEDEEVAPARGRLELLRSMGMPRHVTNGSRPGRRSSDS